MPGERYKHIFLNGPSQTKPFTSPQQGGGKPSVPERDRLQHAAYIKQKLEAAWKSAEDQQAVVHASRTGAYLEFSSEPGFDLLLKSLESLRSGIRLCNVRTEIIDLKTVTRATVYIPNEKRGFFLKKVTAYANEIDSRSNKPKNAKLVNSIADIRSAVLQSFWQDEPGLLPGDSACWIEAWLNSNDLGVIEKFKQLCQSLKIGIGEGQLDFPERTVFLIKVTRNDLQHLLEFSDNIAEFRNGKEVATFFLENSNAEQTQWCRDLLSRAEFHDEKSIRVLILDHGINNGHQLLQPVLSDADRHSVNPTWGNSDECGHGTLMAGTVAYGDLLSVLQQTGSIKVNHRLESSKILPPPPQQNPKSLWGYFTAQGVSRAELQAPTCKRVVCMAVTAQDSRDRGRPSSWSGQIDEMASGSQDDHKRFIIVSAGNVDEPEEWKRYPESNLTNEVHDPAQAWNALTVGAFTEKVQIRDRSLAGYVPKAKAGNLSPFSTTSLGWNAHRWPIKPEVLFEGGNVAAGPNNSILNCDDLQLLSTYKDPQDAQFAPFNATSAASALAANMSAKILAEYPDAWPETVRALMVHTAEWTEAQKQSFLNANSKTSIARLLKICGYGVPNLGRALYCAKNSLTLISQAEIQPFDNNDGRYVSKEMHLYKLPWPKEVLEQLGELSASMRITLSYFVEPSPGEIGWKDRYRYASHGLRFQLNSPGESENEFVRRVNQFGLEDDERPDTESPTDHWTIGKARDVGSIHSDIWQGTAVELAASNLIAVHPTIGWWRERPWLRKWNRNTRYSLIVSISMPVQDIDIYTPVSIKVGIPNPIPIAIQT
jgi:hypothetical protein